MSKIANIISVVFHPLSITSIFFTLLLFTSETLLYPISQSTRLPFLALIIVLSYIIPGLSIALITRSVSLSDFQLSQKTERNMPLLLTAIIYFGLSYFFYFKFRVNDLIYLSLFSVGFCVTIAFLFNFFTKISLHSIAIGGFLGWILAIQYSYANVFLVNQFIIITILGGLVAWARLYLQQHSIWQVVIGYLLGFGICFFTLLIKI